MIISKYISSITTLSRWVAMTAIFMTLFTAVSVICRMFGIPVIGNVELVEIMMLLLIMFSLAYAQSADRHISIGIIADHFPARVQTFIDMLSYIATLIYCYLVGHVFLVESYENFHVSKETTLILQFPLYILKFVVGLGFIIWGLETLNRMLLRAKGLVQSKTEIERELGM